MLLHPSSLEALSEEQTPKGGNGRHLKNGFDVPTEGKVVRERLGWNYLMAAVWTMDVNYNQISGDVTYVGRKGRYSPL
jgi:hypothetical protein